MKKPIIILMFLAFSGCSSNPFRNASLWSGEYTCPQGKTDLDIEVVDVKNDVVKAIFTFNHVPSNVSGSFNMIGQYEQERKKIKFEPLDWISQPDGYYSVGIEGWILDKPLLFEGKVNGPGCTSFSVKPIK